MTETMEDLRQRIVDLEAAARKRFDDCEQPVRNLSISESRVWNKLEKANGKTVHRDILLNEIYQDDMDGNYYYRAVDDRIKRIKKKQPDLGRRIETFYGVGYRLVPA